MPSVSRRRVWAVHCATGERVRANIRSCCPFHCLCCRVPPALQMTGIIACEVQPLGNLRILQHIEAIAGKDARADWAKVHIEKGFGAL